MNDKIEYLKINEADYDTLTKIMTAAFNEDTVMHTDLKEDGPHGYNDGSLIKRLNEKENFESFKVVFDNTIAGAYTVGIKQNNEYSLEMLFIDPKFRKNHLGSTVWKHIEEQYKDAKKWTVETPDYSKRNHHFYTEKCGFVFQRENICSNGAKSFIFEKLKKVDTNLSCEKKCEVMYLGHSGWSLKTANAVLIFDYTRINSVIKDREVLNAEIDIEKLMNQNVYVFVSHEHDDHYDKCIFDWSSKVKSIKYIFGLKSEETKKFIEVDSNEDLNVDDIKISTIEASDDGVGYLVKVDGMSILHLGDHANWCSELNAFFKEQIDYIAQKCDEVDIVFVPIAKGSGLRPQSITDGAKYLIEKLHVKVVFPMHGGGREYLYKEFAEDIKKSESNSKLICAENSGDVWSISLL